ncbi:MAG: hypothetical protein AAB597_03185 [Patescibacteria group bacterium]
MAAYAQPLVAHNDHQPRSQAVPRKKPQFAVFAGDEPKGCAYTVTSSGVHKGVVLGDYPRAIFLGDRESGGWERFLRLNYASLPGILQHPAGYEVLLSAGVETHKDLKTPNEFSRLCAAPEKPDYALVKILTCLRHVTFSKVPQFVEPAEGEPKLIDRGTERNRRGGEEALEEFWKLPKGSALRVQFWDGSLKTVSFDGQSVNMENLDISQMADYFAGDKDPRTTHFNLMRLIATAKTHEEWVKVGKVVGESQPPLAVVAFFKERCKDAPVFLSTIKMIEERAAPYEKERPRIQAQVPAPELSPAQKAARDKAEEERLERKKRRADNLQKRAENNRGRVNGASGGGQKDKGGKKKKK